jgi:hypothetical protein
MSAKSQKQTSLRLFDHLIAAGNQRWWDFQIEHFGGLEIDDEQGLVKGLVQPITDLSETSIGAGFVLFAGRRATNTNAADDLVADFDRHAAADSDKLPIVERGIEGPRYSNLLGQFSR